MSIEVICTHCGKLLRTKDEYAGWRMQCPQCKAMLQLPDLPSPPAAPESPPQPPRESAAAVRPAPIAPPAKPRPEPVKKSGPPVEERPSVSPGGASKSLPGAGQPARPSRGPKPVGDKDPAVVPPRKTPAIPAGRPVQPAPAQAGEPQAKPASKTPPASRRQPPMPSKVAVAKIVSPKPAPQAPTLVCGICGQGAAPQQAVQDPTGQTYHRTCYQQELARRQAATQPMPQSPPGAPAAVVPVATTTPAAVVPVATVGPVDDLWSDLGGPTPLGAAPSALGPSTGLDAAMGTPLYSEPPARLGPGMYILMGVGGAMPVLLILAMVIYSFTRRSAETPVASAPPAAAASTPGTGTPPWTPPSTVPSPPSGAPEAVPPPPPPSTWPQNSSPAPPPEWPSAQPTTSPAWQPPPSQPVPRSSGSAGRSLGAGGMVIVGAVTVVLLLIGLFLGAALLRLACRMCGVDVPEYSSAMATVFLVGVVNFLVGIPLGAVLGPIIGALAGLVVQFPIAAAIFSSRLSIDFGRGLAVAIVQTIMGVVFFVGIGVLLGLLLPLLQVATR